MTDDCSGLAVVLSVAVLASGLFLIVAGGPVASSVGTLEHSKTYEDKPQAVRKKEETGGELILIWDENDRKVTKSGWFEDEDDHRGWVVDNRVDIDYIYDEYSYQEVTDTDYLIEWEDTHSGWFEDSDGHSGTVVDTRTEVVDTDYVYGEYSLEDVTQTEYLFEWTETSTTTHSGWFDDSGDHSGTVIDTRTEVVDTDYVYKVYYNGSYSGTTTFESHSDVPEDSSSLRFIYDHSVDETNTDYLIEWTETTTTTHSDWFDDSGDHSGTVIDTRTTTTTHSSWFEDSNDHSGTMIDTKTEVVGQEWVYQGTQRFESYQGDSYKPSSRVKYEFDHSVDETDTDYLIEWTTTETHSDWFEDSGDHFGTVVDTDTDTYTHSAWFEDSNDHSGTVIDTKTEVVDQEWVDQGTERFEEYHGGVWEPVDRVRYEFDRSVDETDTDYLIEWTETTTTTDSGWFDDRDHPGTVVDTLTRVVGREWVHRGTERFEEHMGDPYRPADRVEFRFDHSVDETDTDYLIEWTTVESGWFEERDARSGTVIDNRAEVDWEWVYQGTERFEEDHGSVWEPIDRVRYEFDRSVETGDVDYLMEWEEWTGGYDYRVVWTEESTDLTVHAGDVDAGDPVTLVARLADNENNGIPGQSIDFYVDGDLIGDNETDSTGRARYTWIPELSPGGHSVEVEYGEGESDLYAGSFGSGTLAFTAPDLVVSDVSYSPSDPEVGEEVSFEVEVRNRGDAPADSSYVYYYLGENYVGRDEVGSLSPGGSWTGSFSRTFDSPNNYRFEVRADGLGTVSESDESNNAGSEELTVREEVWVSDGPVEATVTLTSNGYEGLVELSIDRGNLPDEVEAGLSADLAKLGEEPVEVTLRIVVPRSRENLIGEYELWVVAEGGDYRDEERFTLVVERSRASIRGIDLEEVDRTYEEYFGDDSVGAYYLHDSPVARVDVYNSRGLGLWLKGRVEGPAGYEDLVLARVEGGESEQEFEGIGGLGRYDLREELYEYAPVLPVLTPDLLDSGGREFYGIFGREGGVADWYYEGGEIGNVEIHPLSKEIIEKVFSGSDSPSGLEDRVEAARKLVDLTGEYISYDWDYETDPDCWWENDFTILRKGTGVCADFSILYESLGRSVGLPVRGVSIFWWGITGELFVLDDDGMAGELERGEIPEGLREKFKEKGRPLSEYMGPTDWGEDRWMVSDENFRFYLIEGSGGRIQVYEIESTAHAFNEVYLGEEWRHVDSTWDSSFSPSVYLRSKKIVKLYVLVENSGGGDKWAGAFPMLKYAIAPYTDKTDRGEWKVNVDVDEGGNGTAKVRFLNRAPCMDEYKAKNFHVQIVDDGGLDLSLTQLSEDDTLEAGEIDHATLEARNVQTDNPYIDIKLRFDYETGSGKNIEKVSSLRIWWK